MTWLLCDYGEVLSHAQPADEMAALVAASGRDDSGFWRAYWSYRPGYDRADLAVETYWRSVLGAAITTGRLERLIALDVASWLHANRMTLAATDRAARRGYRLAILSNAPAEIADALDRAPWLSGFEPRLFSCHLGMTKPDPAVYRRVLDCLATEPDGIVFFDDRADNVAAAETIGIRAYRFTHPSQIDALPTPCIDQKSPRDGTE